MSDMYFWRKAWPSHLVTVLRQAESESNHFKKGICFEGCKKRPSSDGLQ